MIAVAYMITAKLFVAVATCVYLPHVMHFEASAEWYWHLANGMVSYFCSKFNLRYSSKVT